MTANRPAPPARRSAATPSPALRVGYAVAALLALAHAGYTLLGPLVADVQRPPRHTWLGLSALCMAGFFIVQLILPRGGRRIQIAAVILPLLAVACAARALLLTR